MIKLHIGVVHSFNTRYIRSIDYYLFYLCTRYIIAASCTAHSAVVARNKLHYKENYTYIYIMIIHVYTRNTQETRLTIPECNYNTFYRVTPARV